MNVYIDLRNIFDIFCIVQGVTTVIWLFLRPKQPANRWLAWLLAGLTLQVIDYFLSRSGIYYHHRELYFMPLFFSWGFGPLLFGYVQASHSTKTATINRWHFLPVTIQVVFYLTLAFQSLDTKAWFWMTVHKPYTRYLDYYVTCLLMLYYSYLSWKTVRKDGPATGWLGWFLKGLVVFYGIAAIDPLINHRYLSPQDPKFYLTAQVLPVFMYALALIGLVYDRFLPTAKLPNPLPVNPDHQQQILRAIREEKLYQDPDLTLASLAQHLGLSPNSVSRTINTGFHQSFNDFINTYRTDEVKQRLAAGDAERVTILALALDAGFSSKTTFNRVFKEQTGYAPKVYLKKFQITPWDDKRAEAA